MKRLQILGAKCRESEKLAQNTKAAAQSAQIQFVMEEITDVTRIADFGVTMTPALAINGEVRSQGKILSVEEIEALIS